LPSTEHHQRTAEKNEGRILSTGRSQEINYSHIRVPFCHLVKEIMSYETIEDDADNIHTNSIE